MHRFSVKPEIYYAENALDCLKIPGIKKVMIIIDPLMQENGYGQRIEEELQCLGGVEFTYFTDIKPDPMVELVIGGVEIVLSFQPDLIVAVGGGSTIDEAKAVVLVSDKIRAAENEHYKKPLFAVIPTTSGTGSEVTNFSVITVDGKKQILVDDGFLPDMAIIDVEFTKTLPLPILADTAVDALTHALEAYISRNGSDCTDAFSEKAIKLVFKYLRQIFEEGDSVEARRRLHNASCIAGMAFTNASLGINHSMAHALGAIFHIPHGKSNAVFLSKTLEFNAQKDYVKEKLYNLCLEMGLGEATLETGAEMFIGAVEELLSVCKMPVHVKDLNVELDVYLTNIFELSKRALEDRCTPTNPVKPTQDDLIRLFIRAYE